MTEGRLSGLGVAQAGWTARVGRRATLDGLASPPLGGKVTLAGLERSGVTRRTAGGSRCGLELGTETASDTGANIHVVEARGTFGAGDTGALGTRGKAATGLCGRKRASAAPLRGIISLAVEGGTVSTESTLGGLCDTDSDGSAGELVAAPVESGLEVVDGLELDVTETLGLAIVAGDDANADDLGGSKELLDVGLHYVEGEVADEGGERRLVGNRNLVTGRVASLGTLEATVAVDTVGDAGKKVVASPAVGGLAGSRGDGKVVHFIGPRSLAGSLVGQEVVERHL